MGRGDLERANSVVDFLIKLLPLVGGFIYINGIIVLSIRLSFYRLLPTSLIDSQYFVAGLPLSFLIFITALTIRWAHKINVDRRKARLLIAFNILLFFTFYWVAKYIVESKQESNWWFVVLFIITQLFIFSSFAPTRMVKSKWFFTFFDYLWVFFCFIFFAVSSTAIYSSLPQSIGGGRIEIVRLYLDRSKAPVQLLSQEEGITANPIALTIPLNLIYKNSTEFVVYPVGTNYKDEIWIISNDVIFSVLISNE